MKKFVLSKMSSICSWAPELLMSPALSAIICVSNNQYESFEVTFREVLMMLAIFDCFFITTASVSFSLPQLSSYWKVNPISNLPHINRPQTGLKTQNFKIVRSGDFAQFYNCSPIFTQLLFRGVWGRVKAPPPLWMDKYWWKLASQTIFFWGPLTKIVGWLDLDLSTGIKKVSHFWKLSHLLYCPP